MCKIMSSKKKYEAAEKENVGQYVEENASLCILFRADKIIKCQNVEGQKDITPAAFSRDINIFCDGDLEINGNLPNCGL